MPKSTVRNYDAQRFGAIIQRLRTERGWTLVRFAQRSGMNATYLSILERGGNMPTLATLFELADVFGLEAADIVREVEQERKRLIALAQAPRSG
jgi:transcriptional regulator with XRE-family HTH domain